MFKYKCVLFSVLLVMISCQNNKAEFSQVGENYFGAKITTDNAEMLSNVLASAQLIDTVDVKISGMIQEVCQAKGCWMTIEDPSADQSVFIKFKDYAFFVPKDAGGKKAVVKGKLYESITSVDELRHYAEDKGASREEIAAIVNSEKELRMMADGVVIMNE